MPLGTSNSIETIIRVREALRSKRTVDTLNKSFLRLQRTIKAVPRALFSLKAGLAGLGVGYIAKQFNDAAVSLERMNLAMTAATGSTKDAESAFSMLRKESERLGLEFESQADGYAKLAAAAKGSKLEGEGIQEVWLSLAEANTALQLTSEDSKWTLYALTQMMSKGKVTAEELRRQLGERLPGAFQIAARAIGVSTKELDKMLEQGNLISEEFLPAFAKQLRKEFGQAAMDASQSWTANMNRMKNHWFDFRNAVMDGDIFPWLKAALMTLTSQVKNFKESGNLAEWAEEIGKKVVDTFEKIILGAAKIYDELMPLLREIKDAMMHIVDIWKDLPTWIQSAGLIGAFLFGKKGVAAIAGYSAVIDYFNKVSKAAGQVLWSFDDEGIKEKWFKLDPETRKYFIDNFEEFGGDVRKFLAGPKGVGTIIKNETEKINNELGVKTFGGLKQGLEEATTATEKAQVVIDFLRNLAKENKNLQKVDRPDTDTVPPITIDPAIAEAADKLSLAKIRERMQTALTKLQNTYDKGLVELSTFYDKRRAMQETAFNAELDALEKQSQAETDIKKKSVIDEGIIKLKGDHVRKLLELDQWYYDEKEKLEEKGVKLSKLLSEVRMRTEEGAPLDLRAQFANEFAEMQENHRLELEEARKLTNDKMKLVELENLHRKEQENLALNHTKRIHDYRLKLASDLAGGLSDIFSNMYELSGQKQREWFYLAKAAAIAEATINVSKAVTEALPNYWLAGAVALKGAAEITKISMQGLAKGGLVQGLSRSPTSDDKIIRATSGEFMQPVKAVKHYGVGVMEAIKNLAIPRNLLTGFNMPAVPTYGMAFAGGGMVPESKMQEPQQSRDTIIANFYDLGEMERFLSTARGQGAVVNVIASKRNEVMRILS